MTNLKPCPFCGKDVTMYSTSRKHAFVIEHKELNNCAFYEFDLPWENAESLAQAKEMWNRRGADE